MTFIVSPSTDPFFNLALEEMLARTMNEEVFMLWRNEPTVVVGFSQNTLAEVSEEYASAHGIRIVRRMTGGGAVYHDLGNVNFSLLQDRAEHAPEYPMSVWARPIADTLGDLGVDAVCEGRNDLAVGGVKVCGMARSVLLWRSLFHGCILYDVDMSPLCEVLKPNPLKLKAKGVSSVRSRVGNIRPLLKEDLSVTEFMERFAAGAERRYGPFDRRELTPWEIKQADELADGKYRTREWTFGGNPPFTCEKSGRFACGTVTLSLSVEHGMITEAAFSGDFFGRRPAAELARLLVGLPCSRSAAAQALKGADIGEYISGAGVGELVSLLPQ